MIMTGSTSGWAAAADAVLSDIDIDWVEPRDRPGLTAAVFSTPRGEVRI